MSAATKKISVAQIKRISTDYLSFLDGWQQIRKDTIARAAGPVSQCIGFERLGDGTYRPVGYLRVLAAPDLPGVMELPQHLNVNVRQLSFREHETARGRVFGAMKREFVPKVERPLDPISVLELYERDAVPNSAEAYSLSVLSAFLGDSDRAQKWDHRFTELVDSLGYWEDWDKERRAFLGNVELWIREGTVKPRLEEVVEEERKKLGFE